MQCSLSAVIYHPEDFKIMETLGRSIDEQVLPASWHIDYLFKQIHFKALGHSFLSEVTVNV